MVPFAAGAGNDLLGRLLAAELTKRLGGQVFVENKPGAASQIGTDLVAKSPPDGYTLLWTASDGLSVLPAVKASVPYKIPDDFVFIASLTRISFVITVNPKLPAKTIGELIAYAKANPGKLNYGSAGLGSAPHMGLALFANAAKISMTHVPFQGLGPGAQRRDGRNRRSVRSPPCRSPSRRPRPAPSATSPSPARRAIRCCRTCRPCRRSGLPVTVQVFFGLLAPKNTPEPIVARLRKEIAEIAKEPAVVERLQHARLSGGLSRRRRLSRHHPQGPRAMARRRQGGEHQDQLRRSSSASFRTRAPARPGMTMESLFVLPRSWTEKPDALTGRPRRVGCAIRSRIPSSAASPELRPRAPARQSAGNARCSTPDGA